MNAMKNMMPLGDVHNEIVRQFIADSTYNLFVI